MTDLNIKSGDWAVLRNGEVRGPVSVDKDDGGLFPIKIDGDESLYYMSWTAEGWENVDPEHVPDTDIIDTLPCPPLQRIRELEAENEKLKAEFAKIPNGGYWRVEQ